MQRKRELDRLIKELVKNNGDLDIKRRQLGETEKKFHLQTQEVRELMSEGLNRVQFVSDKADEILAIMNDSNEEGKGSNLYEEDEEEEQARKKQKQH